MLINFRVGFSDFESLDLTESQIIDLLRYRLNDIYVNQAIVSVIKSGDEITEENIDKTLWHELMQK